jgi:SAM-dependent methyltransferase
MLASYDTIGVNYSDLRKPDPRIGALIDDALGSATTVLNVGAGAGSYEPAARRVTALEFSGEMIRQRPHDAAPVVQGRAEALPFAHGSFDASMAVLSVHHWTDQQTGLREMRRVTRGAVVLLTFDTSHPAFWLADYISALVTLDEAIFPSMKHYEQWLGPVDIVPVPIPHDCSDGFLCAYWRRPEAYLNPRVRQGISSFWKIGDITGGLKALADDLKSGAWAARHAVLLDRDEADFGYRLVVSRPA